MPQLHLKTWLLIAFLPYLALAAYDGWLHEKARRVPRLEQLLHAVLALAVIAVLRGLFFDRPGWIWPALAAFTVAGLIDELGYHGTLERRERRLHHLAYACFAAFIGVAAVLGALPL